MELPPAEIIYSNSLYSIRCAPGDHIAAAAAEGKIARGLVAGYPGWLYGFRQFFSEAYRVIISSGVSRPHAWSFSTA